MRYCLKGRHSHREFLVGFLAVGWILMNLCLEQLVFGWFPMCFVPFLDMYLTLNCFRWHSRLFVFLCQRISYPPCCCTSLVFFLIVFFSINFFFFWGSCGNLLHILWFLCFKSLHLMIWILVLDLITLFFFLDVMY